MRLVKNDYINIGSMLLMLALVSYSLVTSEFFPHDTGITGRAVMILENNAVSIDYLRNEYDEAYVNTPITFYASIIDTSTQEPRTDATCTIVVQGNQHAMPFDSFIKQYQYVHTFTQNGTYEYEVSCTIPDGSPIEKQGVATISTPLPDFTITLQAPLTGAINSQIEVTVTVQNIGPGAYTSEVPILITGADNTIHSTAIPGEEKKINISFANTGTKIITATVNHQNVIQERNTSNNQATRDIMVINPQSSEPTCGELWYDANMTKNLYCPNGITITQPITLDCKGHRIYGEGFTVGTGITTMQEATIKNCQIDRYHTAVRTHASTVLQNTTIKDVMVGAMLNSTENTLTHNIFNKAGLAILNIKESKIHENDFIENTHIINTSVAVNLTRNYFDGKGYHAIMERIVTNDHDVHILPYLSETARGNPQEVHEDITPPNVTVSVEKRIQNHLSSITIHATTDKDGVCRYSLEDKAFENMHHMSTQNAREHQATRVFSMTKTITIHVLCKDTVGNPGQTFISDETHISSTWKNIQNVTAEAIKKYEEHKEEFEERKKRLNDDLQNALSQALREQIQKEIRLIDLEITYYNALIIAKKQLEQKAKEDERKADDSHKKMAEAAANIKTIQEELIGIEESWESALISGQNLYTILNRKYNLLNEKTQNIRENATANNEFRTIKEQYRVDLLKLEEHKIKAELNLAVNKDAADEQVDYSNHITILARKLGEVNESISNAEREQLLEKFDHDLFRLDVFIRSLDQLRVNLHDLIQDVDDALIATSDTATRQQLTNLKENIERRIEIIETEVVSLEDMSASLVEEQRNFRYERDDDNQIVIPEIIHRSMNITWEIGQRHVHVQPETIYLTDISFAVERENTTSPYALLEWFNESPVRSQSIEVYEWYIITDNGNTLTNISLTFQLNDEQLSAINVTGREVKLIIYNETRNGWFEARTTYEADENQTHVYTSNMSEFPSAFAIGHIKREEQECVTVWRCGEYGECEDGNQTRTCTDINQCNINETEREETQACIDEKTPSTNETCTECSEECPDLCPEIEQPNQVTIELPERSQSGSNAVIVIIISLLLGAVGFGGFKFMKGKGKAISTAVKETITPHEMYSIDAIMDSIYMNMKDHQIIQSMMQQKMSEQYAKQYVAICRHILKELEEGASVATIVAKAEKNGWKKAHAQAVIERITVKYLTHQIREYFQVTNDPHEEFEVIKDILKQDNFEERMIQEAIESYHKMKKQGTET